MKIITLDLAELSHSIQQPQDLPASVLTIGNFDGVHLGHQAIFNQLKETASQHNLASMVMVFEPQPREYFATLKGNPLLAPARLTSKDEKIALLKAFDIEIIVIATFNTSFRSLSASQFANMLADKLNVKRLVLGDDFRFGNDRIGDSEFLRNYGLPVTNLHTITETQVNLQEAHNQDANEIENRISSTKIRELLNSGNLEVANRLLGRDYTIVGNVIEGDKIGRTLDFPTANIELNRLRPVLHGVYGVDVVILDNDNNVIENAFTNLATDNTSPNDTTKTIQQTLRRQTGIAGLRPHSLFGTANIGVRPSVDKPHDWRLEVFFPEFSGNLYGKTLDVRFLHHLHEERKYPDLKALKVGIHRDVQDLIAWRNTVT